MRKTILVVDRNISWFLTTVGNKLVKAKSAERGSDSSSWIIDGVEYKYVSSPSKLRGYRGVKIEFWDGARQNPNYSEFRDTAKAMGMVENSVSG